LLQ
jgi:hypothetical protein